MRKSYVKVFVGMFVLGLCFSYLFISGTKDSLVYFLTVSELQQRSSMLQNKALRVTGKVKHETVKWDSLNLSLEFMLTDGAQSIKIHYIGIKPDMFKEGGDVIVEGTLSPLLGINAFNLMTSCPSKYQEETK